MNDEELAKIQAHHDAEIPRMRHNKMTKIEDGYLTAAIDRRDLLEEVKRLRKQIARVEALARYDRQAECLNKCQGCRDGYCELAGLDIWLEPEVVRAALAEPKEDKANKEDQNEQV